MLERERRYHLEWLAYIVEHFTFICQSLDFMAQRKSDTSRSLHTEQTFSNL